MNGKVHIALLCAALALGAGFRFYRLDWGRPEVFHPDEARISYAIGDIDRQVAALEARKARGENPGFRERLSAYNPHFFAYGSLPLFLIRTVWRLHPRWDLFVIGRAWSAFFDTLTILVLFLLGGALFSRRTGCLAACFFAFAVFHIQLSHFLTVDVMLASLVVAAVYFCARVMEGGRFRHYCMAGLIAGLAMATKATAAPVLLPLLFAHFAFSWRNRRMLSIRQWAKCAAGLAAAALFFIAGEPFFLIDHAEFMRQISEQRNMVSGRWAPPWTLQYEHTVPGMYQLKNLIAYCLGFPLGIAVVGGSVYAAWRALARPDRRVFLLLAWLLPVGGATFFFKIKFIRYMAPLIPFLCLLAAEGIGALHGRLRDRFARGLLVALTLLAVAFSFTYSLAYMAVYRNDNTRVEASRWIYANIPRGSHILGETWEFGGLPTGTREGNPAEFRYTVAQMDIYSQDDRGKARRLAQELAKGTLVAIPTKRMYGSVLRVPEKYPVSANYYRLLFSGKLGYRLAKSVTSYPRLGRLRFNDDFADESFTVYDHPKALLFRKTTQYPAGYLERLLNTQPKIDYWPVLADALGADEANRPAAAAARVVPSLGGYLPPPYRGARNALAWLAAIEIMGIIALPLAASFFRSFRDGGWAFSRTLAVAVAGYLVWIAASLGAMPFSRGTIFASLAAVLLLSLHRCARGFSWRVFLAPRWRAALASEAVFLAVFSLFLVFRRYNPDIYWSESSMDFSFINSVLRSSSFPPIDPWTSGTYLNYYYYGHYLVAMLIKLAGIPPKVGYNLAFCLIPALVVSGVFSIVFSLTGKVRYGIFGGACAGLLGNLDGFFLLIDGRPWRSAFYRALHLSIPTHPESVFRFFRCAHEVIQNTVHEFPFWSFIFVDLHAHVIAMPFAVLLCALALSLFMNPRRGLGFRGRGGEGASDFFIAAVALGMMIPMNTWDFPTYTAALGVLMLLKELHRRNLGGAAIPLSGYSFWWDARLFGRVLRVLLAVVRLEGRAGGAIRAVARTAVLVSLLAASAIAAYSPFFQFFGREGMGIGLVGGLTTRLGAELRFFGFFLFIIASFLYCECARWVNGRPGRAARALFILLLLAAALSPWAAYRIIGTRDYGTLSLCLALLLPGLLALFRLRAAPPAVYSLVLICYGLAVAGFCELFHIRDFLQGGEWKRMNTIFKFYMPVWFFFSIGGSYCLSRLAAYPPCRPEGAMRLLSLGKRAIWTAVFCALLAASLVFTVMGPRARTIGDDNYSRSSLEPPFAPRGEANREGAAGFLNLALPRALRAPTLDGLAWMKDRFPDDYEAVSWLGAAVPGQPVIIEATGADYLYDFARVSSNTGIPAVLGWWSHVDQRGYAFRDVRRKDVADFYKSSDPAELAALIAKYDIGYVYVGNTERLAWSPDELKKFDLMTGLFRPVFRNGNAAVYQTRAAADVAPSSPAGGAAVPPPEAAAPHVKLTERSEGDGPGEYNEPRGVALDRRGGVYVADFRNYRIQKFDPKGFYVAAWGEEGSYPGQFKDPCDVAVDEKGRVYVADTFNHRIQVLSPEGKFLFAVEGGFFAPRGVAVDMKGRIWVADTGNSVVKVFSSDGAPLMTIGRKGRGREEFDGPNSLAVNRKGRVYVADTGNRRVQILDRNGRYAGEFKVDGWQAGVFDEPYLDVDARGDIYLTDPPGNRALRYSADGTLLGTLAPREGSEPMLLFPMGIAVENEGRAVYIVDCRHNRVRAFTKGDFK